MFSIFGKGKIKENCKIITIDNFVKLNQLARIDFIKIDVEGYEYKVLKGAIETIKKFSPTIILEFNQYSRSLSNINVHEFNDFIKPLNYNVYGLYYGWKEKLVQLNNFINIEDISDIILTTDTLN